MCGQSWNGLRALRVLRLVALQLPTLPLAYSQKQKSNGTTVYEYTPATSENKEGIIIIGHLKSSIPLYTILFIAAVVIAILILILIFAYRCYKKRQSRGTTRAGSAGGQVNTHLHQPPTTMAPWPPAAMAPRPPARPPLTSTDSSAMAYEEPNISYDYAVEDVHNQDNNKPYAPGAYVQVMSSKSENNQPYLPMNSTVPANKTTTADPYYETMDEAQKGSVYESIDTPQT